MDRCKAVIDRIVENKHAVLLIGNDEREKIIPVTELPEKVSAGEWIIVEFEATDTGDIDILSIIPDKTETDVTRKRIKNKMDMLRQRSKRKN